MEKSLEEKRAYVKENRLCYGCLKQGHSAKECRRRLKCDTCSRKHPTCLHDDNFTKGERQVNTADPTHNSMSETTTAISLNVAREGQSASTSMIVPVWVSSTVNPYREKLVYALLDTQSDTAFIDQEVSCELQINRSPVKLKLTTMMGENAVINSERISGLRVRGYNSATHILLPPAYTKDHIPVNREHIPTCETAKRWSHLSPIADEVPSLLNCEIGLLIGYNCPKALAPKKVILGEDDEPYAVQTELGWSIVGTETPHHETDTRNSLCHRVAVKEIPPVTPVDAIQASERDFTGVKESEKTVSQEDLIFLDKRKEGIIKDEQGHYETPLPFKERPYMPDNRQLAKIRLNHLKRKLSKDERYKEDYVKHMSDIIKKGDAEEAQGDGHNGNKIPHHGIYLPKKPEKLQVAFDCSAKDKGTCLNEHLLSGPDIKTNTRWERWKRDLVNLEKVQIARCYMPTDFGKVEKRELHHFSDASTTGYGQCSYLRLINKDGGVHCAFIMGKARVSPTKVSTIPRLELTAATVSVTVSNMLKEELAHDTIDEFFWTDSKVTLGYIHNDARRFHTFVANRVQKIRNSTAPQQWLYVPTKENPADYASRGTTVGELLSSEWFTGPRFLWEKEIHPPAKVILDLQIGDPEVKRAQTLLTKTAAEVSLSDRLVKFSSWSKAVSAVARLKRRLLKDKSNIHSTVSEQQDAELVIKDLQKQAYMEEIKTLNDGNLLPRNNKLHHLDLFLDKDAMLKVGGRLRCSSLPSLVKHPTVISRQHHAQAKMACTQEEPSSG